MIEFTRKDLDHMLDELGQAAVDDERTNWVMAMVTVVRSLRKTEDE